MYDCLPKVSIIDDFEEKENSLKTIAQKYKAMYFELKE